MEQPLKVQIEAANDSELSLLATAALGTGAIVPVDGTGALMVMHHCGLSDAEMTLVCRSGIGLESIAVYSARPGWVARVVVRHARPEVAVLRAFLFGTHGLVPLAYPTTEKATCFR